MHKCYDCDHFITDDEYEYAELNGEFPLRSDDELERHIKCTCQIEDFECKCNFEKDNQNV